MKLPGLLRRNAVGRFDAAQEQLRRFQGADVTVDEPPFGTTLQKSIKISGLLHQRPHLGFYVGDQRLSAQHLSEATS